MFFGLLVAVMPVEDSVILKAIFQRKNGEDKHDIDDAEGMVTNEEIDFIPNSKPARKRRTRWRRILRTLKYDYLVRRCYAN